MCDGERGVEVLRHFPGESARWERTFWTVLPGAAASVVSRGDDPAKALALAAEMADGANPLYQEREEARRSEAQRVLAEATALVLSQRDYVTRSGESCTRLTVERVEGLTCVFTDGSTADVAAVAGGEGFEPYPRTPEASGCAGVVDDIAAETVAGALRVVGVGPDEVEVRCRNLLVTVKLENGVDAAELHGMLTELVRSALVRLVERRCGAPASERTAVQP